MNAITFQNLPIVKIVQKIVIVSIHYLFIFKLIILNSHKT